MAFENLTERLQQAMSKLRKKGKVSETDVKEMMREIRLALLEARCKLTSSKRLYKACSRTGDWCRSIRKFNTCTTNR